MINFIDGQINLDEKNIVSASNYEGLATLAAKGLIEKKEYSRGIYYYVDHEIDNMRFGIFISLKAKKIEYIALRWLDGPCTSKAWAQVSEKALKEEYRLLSNFVEKKVGRPPSNTRDRQRSWRFAWGQIDVSYESRDFVTQIHMKPR